MCHAALSEKTNVFANTTLHCDLSREALETRAHVMHVRDADKTNYGTLREKNHVCWEGDIPCGFGVLCTITHLQRKFQKRKKTFKTWKKKNLETIISS